MDDKELLVSLFSSNVVKQQSLFILTTKDSSNHKPDCSWTLLLQSRHSAYCMSSAMRKQKDM